MDNVLHNERPGGGLNLGQAWCVSHSNFVRLAQITQDHGFHDDVHIPVDAAGKNIGADAVMMDSSSKAELSVHSIRIVALASTGRAVGHGKWRYLSEGSTQCTDCYAVNVPRVPPETNVLSASAQLNFRTDGMLYLATIGY